MSATRDQISARTFSELSEIETLRFSVDLVSAARKNVELLRAVNDSQWLHEEGTILEAIRRYDELWMPLISDVTVVGLTPPMILPPLDIEWVWFCHTLNPESYREYCERRFSKLIGKVAIFDEENEEYALMRCVELWDRKYPTESFENQVVIASSSQYLKTNSVIKDHEDLYCEVKKQRFLYSKFSCPYMSEIVYLIAAKQRYKGFLFLLQRLNGEDAGGGGARLVPCLDIFLMWMTHQSYPVAYAEDLKEMEDEMRKVVGIWETVKKNEMEETRKLWENFFDQPYEKAGGAIAFGRAASLKPPVYWDVSDVDVNTKYKSLLPRFLLEVCVFARLNARMKATQEDTKKNFLRMRLVRCHRDLKIDKPIPGLSAESWIKVSHLYCEFATKGLMLELRKPGSGCFAISKLENSCTFLWNDLLRAHSLTLRKDIDNQVHVVASITPPVQAPYLLKCVPDKVTDDSGAMISDVILKMNHYKPQEGRWLSRTILDHAGRVCFVVRMRIGRGFYRRGGETPSAVKWEDRIIEIREGPWSYVAGSIGRAPEKVVGTAAPKESPDDWEAAWYFSTGEELLVSWGMSMSIHELRFCLRNQATQDSRVKLLKGRRMQYRWSKLDSNGKDQNCQNKEAESEREEAEAGFLTLVRYTEDDPSGRATALLNWKLLVVEFMPEEDAIFVLLLCISILKSISEMRKEDVGSLLIRRRLKETKQGVRDWGSVILHPSAFSAPYSTPYLQPWYWNAEEVMASDASYNATTKPALNYSQVEGGDKMYKRGIIS